MLDVLFITVAPKMILNYWCTCCFASILFLVLLFSVLTCCDGDVVLLVVLLFIFLACCDGYVVLLVVMLFIVLACCVGDVVLLVPYHVHQLIHCL